MCRQTGAIAWGLAFLVSLTLLPGVVEADPITVTSGDLHFDTGDPPYFTLNGSGVSVGGVVTGGQWMGSATLAACGFNCPGGTSVNLGSVFGGPGAIGAGSPLAFGSATIGGVTFNNPSGPDVWFSGVLSFTTPSVTLGGGVSNYSAPFTLSGNLRGYATSDLAGSPLFDVSLAGSGDATLRTSFNASTDRYQFVSMSYQFKNTAVTPEPASMILLASGTALTGFLARRRRRQSA